MRRRLRSPLSNRLFDRERIDALFNARDPGRARLTAALAVSLGVLSSALISLGVVDAMHADKALLALAVFFSLQAGNAAKDRRAISRLITTAVLLPTVVGGLLLAALLSGCRPAQIAVFVVITGAAIWVREFGPRAAAIGLMFFISYFFALFMKTTLPDAAAACIVAAIAVGTQFVARSILLVARPRRQIVLLLRELRIASAVAVRGASYPNRERPFRNRLARIDRIARGIRSWQRSYSTSDYFECSEEYLDALALDARADTQEACYELAALHRAKQQNPTIEVQQLLAALDTVLKENSTARAIDEAVSLAETQNVSSNSAPERVALVLLAKSILAHAHLRSVSLAMRPPRIQRGTEDSGAQRAKLSVLPPLKNRPPSNLTWGPSARMAVQAMVAAVIASGVGEAISASRWYWAVMSAFVVFVGATSRSSILTRAFRRVAGTAVGIVLGFGAVGLVHSEPLYLIVIGVVGVFGMLYFGPLNYLYSALFLTVMLVAIYAMLGVLDQNILELRLVETISGAAIGVLSAYLIFTSNSQPVLTMKVRAYFDSLDALLAAVGYSFSAQGVNDELQLNLDALEASQADLDVGTAAMSTAFLLGNHRRETEAVHLMYTVTRSAARVVQAATDRASPVRDCNDAAVIQAIAQVRSVVTTTLNAIITPEVPRLSARETSVVAGHLASLPAASQGPESAALMALLRMEWALRKAAELWVSEDQSPTPVSATPKQK